MRLLLRPAKGMLMQILDSKDNERIRVGKTMEQVRRSRKRLVALGIFGGVLVAGTALVLALGSGHKEVLPRMVEASLPPTPVSPAPLEPLSTAPVDATLPLETDSRVDPGTSETPSPESPDDQMPLQASMPSNTQPDAEAEAPEDSPMPAPEIGATPAAREPAGLKFHASKPKKVKHASAKARRHSHTRKTYVTVFPERRNYHYGFPAVSN